MLHLMRLIMNGELSPVMTASIITGLRVKKETIGEITAAAQVMRELSNKVPLGPLPHLVDVVGTGGDGAHSFNISTCSMFVAAAAGAQVAKHGNRSVSSKTGSADVLEALGVNIKLIHAVVFALGVGLATVAGMIAAPISSVYPNMGSSVLIMCFVVVVIGGIGSVRGALISALLVGLVDTFGKVLLPSMAGMLVYMLMAAVLLWKPEGLFKQ
eukprot:gene49478-60578_t